MKRPLPPVTRGTPLRSLIENEFGNEGCETLSELFVRLGYERGMVVHGVDGLDEVSNIGPTKVCEYNNGAITEYVLTPQDLEQLAGR